MQMTVKDIFLSPELNTGAHMLTHIQIDSPLHELYGCPECDRVSTSMEDFKKHTQAHTKSQDAVCKICHKRYKTVKSLRRHEKTHLKNIEPVIVKQREPEMPCPQCPMKFSTKTALHWHVERNHMEKEKTSTCEVCGTTLSDHALLKRHLETVHSLETATCLICSKIFKSHVNMQRHMAVTHPSEQAEQSCQICKKTFKCSTHLRIHIRTVHSAQTVFNCDLCNKGFSLKKYMLKHRKTHVDVKEIQCDICYRVYKTVTDVRRHAKRVHMKTEESNKMKALKCNVCDKEFTRTKYLLIHKKTHDDKTISCKLCNKMFKCTSHVNKHTKRVHTNKSPEKNTDTAFYCDICKKCFGKKKNLAKHIKTHIFMKKETPCDICNKLFKTNSDVNRHLRKVHMKNMNINEMIIKNKYMKTMNANAQVETNTEDTLTYIDDALRNIDYTENIFASTQHEVKALEITEYTNEVPRSEDYRLATLGNAEYRVETLQCTDIFDGLNTEASECAEEFVNIEITEYKKEALRDTQFTGQELTNRDFTDKAFASTECAKALQSTNGTHTTITSSEFVENTDHTDFIRCAKYIKEDHTNTEKLIECPDLVEVLDRTECRNEDIGDTHKQVNSHRSTDIIKAAIESSDFTMEDLGLTEVPGDTVISVESEDIIKDPVLIADFGTIELTKVPKGTDFKHKLGNMDIIKAAIDISDFSMEDLGITDTEDAIDNRELENKAMSSTGMNKEVIENVEPTEDLASTDFIDALANTNCKTLGNTDIIKDAIESSNFTIEDLGLEYTEALDTEYTIEDFGITECTETLGSTEFVEETLTSTDFIEEALSSTANAQGAGTHLIKKTIGNTDIIEEAFASTEYIKEVATDFTEDVLGNAVFAEQVLESTFFEDVLDTDYKKVPATKYTGKVGTDFLEEVLIRADFTEEAMRSAVTEKFISKDLIEARDNTEYANEIDDDSAFTIKTVRNTDIIKEVIEISDFEMEDLENVVQRTDYAEETKQSEVDLKSIEIKLLKCLKCGIDFENDVDLHTHLCGDEMTLFLDFQEM